MGSARRIVSAENHFVRQPYREVLYVLQDAERRGEGGRSLKPKEIRGAIRGLRTEQQLLLRLMQDTGTSREEMLQVRIEDIDLDKGRIRLEGRDGKEKYISVQSPEVLRALKRFIGPREKGWLFVPKSMALSPSVGDISSARLSQVLGQLKYYGLVRKESGRYRMSSKYVHAFRRDYICEKLFYDDKGEVHWGRMGWWLSRAVLDDSEAANEIRKELGYLARSFVGKRLMGRIDELNRAIRMEEIADHLLDIFEGRKLSTERRGYILHYVRGEIRHALDTRFANKALGRAKEPNDASKRQLGDVSGMIEGILRDEWDAIRERKLGDIEDFEEIDRVSKEYYQGKKPAFDDEFLEWLYFEAFEGKSFVFGGYPLLVLGDFSWI